MQVEFFAPDVPQGWIETIANQLNVQVKNDSFELPASVGEGTFSQYYPSPGLTLTYIHAKLLKPFCFVRKPIAKSPLIPVMFFSQELPLKQDIDGQEKIIGYHTANGIFMPSAGVGSKWVVPENKWLYNVTITYSIDWMLERLKLSKDTYMQQILDSDKPFYLFENLTPAMIRVISSIDVSINSGEKLLPFILHQKTVELLTLFLEKVEQRTIIKDAAKLHTTDVEQIFEIRKILLEKLPDVPSIKELACDSGMSVSKLQKCFRQVFGKSIAQYALSEKMQLARKLLDSQKYSVSEVGYRLGYSNLSHFSEAFNNEFGIKPKAYLLSKTS